MEKFGRDFFKNAPVEPGVYVFRGARDRVLYVGQSHNLKVRLAYYKNAQPEREPRRIIRLIHETEKISWRTCSTAEEAQLIEIEQIRELRPKFNRALTSTPSYAYFGIRPERAGVHIELKHGVNSTEGQTWIGAFKNYGLCRRTLLALGRALWISERAIKTVLELPIELGSNSRRLQCTVSVRKSLVLNQLCSFLRGQSNELSEILAENVEKVDSFSRQFMETDLQLLTEFFQLAERMKRAREFLGTSDLLAPEKIDSALLKLRWRREGSTT